MVRSLSVWVLLASAGLVGAQSPMAGSTAVLDVAGATITVHEQGKTANKCMVLKTWLMPDGSRAYEAQSVINGDMLTVVESGPPEAVTPASKIEVRATQVYHWVAGQIPPAGAPTPRDGAAVTTGVRPVVHTTVDQGQVMARPSPKPAAFPGPVAAAAQPMPCEQPSGAPVTELAPPSDASRVPAGSCGVMPAGGVVPQAAAPVMQAAAQVPPAPVPGTAASGPMFVPVPVVTVPDYRNPPQLPAPRMPQAPQPTGAPAAAPMPGPVTPPSTDLNAFTQAGPALPPAMTSNGFGPIVPASSPYAAAPQPQGMSRAPLMPPGVAMPTPGMPTPGMPYPPAGNPAVATGSTMRLPLPAPAAANPVPASPAPAIPAYVPPGQTDPAVRQQANTTAPQAVLALRNALLPTEREQAVSRLTQVDWRSNPSVVPALLAAAAEDPAPSVRAACVRALVQMNANTWPVFTALQRLRKDADTRVLQEVEQALTAFSASPTGGQEVRPAGYPPR
jgi:hypothetical protein